MNKRKLINIFLVILILFNIFLTLPIVKAEPVDITESNNSSESSDTEEDNEITDSTDETVKDEEPSTPPDEEDSNDEDSKQDNIITYIQYTGRNMATDGLNIRSIPSSSGEIKGALAHNETFKYRDSDIYTNENDTCTTWIYISARNGYVCKTYIEEVSSEEITIDTSNENEFSKMTDEEFDTYLTNQGFDETYKEKIKELHKKYPNWVFKGVKTNRDWNSTVKEESTIGYSTYYMDAFRESAGHEAYLSTDSYYNWETDLFSGYDGWFFLANSKTVAYFLDPRNYLNESNIFMYESLYYDGTYQTKDKITTILGTSNYNDYIYDAGFEYNYSPIAAAIKIRQEGTLNNRPTSGIAEITCSGGLNPYYDTKGQKFLGPLYNFFNIGATSRPSDADLNGLCYAAITNDNYLLPWNTPEKAIKGGIKWISTNYISGNQYTNYFQKFNTENPNTEIWHQYMTNLEDPKSQSTILYNLYNSYDLLDTPFVFYIPIYDNMPEVTTLPKTGNPNNWLTDLSVKVNDTTSKVSNFSGSITEYTINVPYSTNSIAINSTTVAKTSYVSIDGNDKVLKTNSKQVALEEQENTFDIVVTAGNGNTKTYTLKVIKEEPEEEEIKQPTIEEMIDRSQFKLTDSYISGITFGMGSSTMTDNLLEINKFATIQITNNKDEVKTIGALGTGDKITITSNNETKTFEIVLYGDVNGDGQITLVDIVAIQKHLWKEIVLDGYRLKAADVTRDDYIKLNDIVAIQKHLWKEIVIPQ